MKNGMIKLLGAVTLATTPMVSLVACGGMDSEVISELMEGFSSITVNVKTTAGDADKKKAADTKIKKILKALGLKVSGEIKYTEDFTEATFSYTLNKDKKTKTITIKYDTEKTATEKAIEGLSPTYAAKIDAASFDKDEDVKTKAEGVVKDALADEKDNVNYDTKDPEADGDKKIVSVVVTPKTGKGQDTLKKEIKVTIEKEA